MHLRTRAQSLLDACVALTRNGARLYKRRCDVRMYLLWEYSESSIHVKVEGLEMSIN